MGDGSVILVFVAWLIQLSIIVLSLIIGWRIMAATERIADAVENQKMRKEIEG